MSTIQEVLLVGQEHIAAVDNLNVEVFTETASNTVDSIDALRVIVENIPGGKMYMDLQAAAGGLANTFNTDNSYAQTAVQGIAYAAEHAVRVPALQGELLTLIEKVRQIAAALAIELDEVQVGIETALPPLQTYLDNLVGT